MGINIELPEPGADALAHSEKLCARIRERIGSRSGWIDFSEYMEMALYSPGLGYYSAGTQKFGAAGDFVTAPEVSRLFSRCIARVVAEVFEADASGVVLELGAGSGRMAAEIIRSLEKSGSRLDRYLILEVSGDLRERQRQTICDIIPDWASRVEWLDALPQQPIDGLILANEVVDALPVTRFLIEGDAASATGRDRVQSSGVGIDRGTFCWQTAPAKDHLVQTVEKIERELGVPFPDGYCSEVIPGLQALMNALAGAMNRGLMLFIDYGLPRSELFHRDRRQGTLTCHYRHRAHADPFLYPGLQDITAWVDFTAVAEAGKNAGLDVAGYTTQAHFLIGAGLEQEFNATNSRGFRQQAELSNEMQMLTMPGQMGERFKVIGLTCGSDFVPTAFRYRDLRHHL